ncbi:MAG: ATP-binding protein [Candidatus Competibacteraceae bacterium]|jgi:signal transduction histidine kinase|nr:ATP-binding protein [Candidatus Competibacteraceae bacterium]
MGRLYLTTVRARLIVLSVVGALATIATVVIILYLTQARVVDQVKHNATLLANVLALEHKTQVSSIQQMLALLAQIPAIQSSPPDCTTAFRLLDHPLNEFMGFALLSPMGDLYCTQSPVAQLIAPVDREFFARVAQTQRFHIRDHPLVSTQGDAHLLAVLPLMSAANQVESLLVGVLNMEWFDVFLAETPPLDGTAILMVDQQGQVLARYPHSFAAIGENFVDTAFYQALLGPSASSGEILWRDGEEKILGFAVPQDHPFNVYISVLFNKDQLWQHTLSSLLQGITLVALALVGVFLFILYGNYQIILRYLNSLVDTTRKMAAGDLSVRSEWATDVSEFGTLARAFNTMAEAMAQREQKLRDHAVMLEKSNIELEQFAYVASHDLKEPLRMVASFCNLLQQRYADQLDAKAQQYIAYAVDGAQRMQTLINDLLTLSRVGTQQNTFTAVDCNTVLQAVLGDLQHIIQQYDAHIVTPSPLPIVHADSTEFGQLLQNLIGNAIKFRGDAPPRIKISAIPDDDEWIFAVRDNGIGIAPEFKDRIFLIFQRLHHRENYSGNGIGLAVCKKIVERYGGRIWVESEPSKGSTFYFTLPR